MNKLLLRQIKKKYGRIEDIPKELTPLLDSISESYNHFERDRLLTERSMEISSRELREAFEKLEQRNKILEEYAYIIAHDLQSPVRSIVGFNQLILKRFEAELPNQVREMLAYSVTAAKEIHELLNGLLEYAIIGKLQYKTTPVNMNEVADAVIQMFSVEINALQGRIEVETALPIISGYRPHLIQVMMNLVSNAIKYKSEAPPNIKIGVLEKADGFAHFYVSDNGIGIHPTYEDKIFMIFQRLDKERTQGTGLGLALCKQIINQHNGEIWLDTNYTNGTSIRFTLPNI